MPEEAGQSQQQGAGAAGDAGEGGDGDHGCWGGCGGDQDSVSYCCCSRQWPWNPGLFLESRASL